MDLWRGEAYSKFFEHLESKRGFYYEVRHFLPLLTSIQPCSTCACSLHHLISPEITPALTLLHSLFVPRHQQRWGDAPVHSIGAALFARKDQIHFFDDIGYQHPPFMHCPRLHNVRKERNCSCKPYQSFGESRSHSSPPLPSRSLRPRLRPANASQFRAVASERGMGPSMRSLSNAGQLAD